MDERAAAREAARTARRAVMDAERTAKEARITDSLLALPELRDAKRIGCYVSVHSEVDTRRILRGLLARGIVVGVPAAPDEGMRFARLDHPWALVPGTFGIPEPHQPWQEVEGDTLDAVIVPGLRFGRDGSRLGNGGGHFDRFLAAHANARRIGLAFTEQVVDRLDVQPHDQGMDVIVTDTEVLRCVRLPSPTS